MILEKVVNVLIEVDAEERHIYLESLNVPATPVFRLCKELESWKCVAAVTKAMVVFDPHLAHIWLEAMHKPFHRADWPFRKGRIKPALVMGLVFGALEGAMWMDDHWPKGISVLSREQSFPTNLPEFFTDVIIFQFENWQEIEKAMQDPDFAGELSKKAKAYAAAKGELGGRDWLVIPRRGQVANTLLRVLRKLKHIDDEGLLVYLCKFGLELMDQFSYSLFKWISGNSEAIEVLLGPLFDEAKESEIDQPRAYQLFDQLQPHQRAWVVQIHMRIMLAGQDGGDASIVNNLPAVRVNQTID